MVNGNGLASTVKLFPGWRYSRSRVDCERSGLGYFNDEQFESSPQPRLVSDHYTAQELLSSRVCSSFIFPSIQSCILTEFLSPVIVAFTAAPKAAEVVSFVESSSKLYSSSHLPNDIKTDLHTAHCLPAILVTVQSHHNASTSENPDANGFEPTVCSDTGNPARATGRRPRRRSLQLSLRRSHHRAEQAQEAQLA